MTASVHTSYLLPLIAGNYWNFLWIPVFWSWLYHPIQMTKFVYHYLTVGRAQQQKKFLLNKKA